MPNIQIAGYISTGNVMTRYFYAIISIIIITLSGCSQLSDQASAGKKQIALVTVQDSALRLDPLQTSARITVLGTGENAEVIDRSREKGSIAGKHDYWYKVRLRSGIFGWIWGQNVKIFAEGENASVERFARELRKEEEIKVRKELKGKWWSVSGEDNFTNHILIMREDGTYSALVKDSDKPVDGNYTLDTEKSLVSFDKGTAFGDSISYIIRGDFYVLEAISDTKHIKFKRISSDPNFKDELAKESAPPSEEKKEEKKEGQ
jgi:hypothetical protein